MQLITIRTTNTRDKTVGEFTFRRLPIRIGRSSINDLQLDVTFVSQFHAVLEDDAGALILRDLGSRNGTSIAGKRVPPHQPTVIASSFDIGPLHVEVMRTDVPTSSVGTEMMMSPLAGPGGVDANATEIWQAFADTPASDRDARDVALKGLRHLARWYVPRAGTLETPEDVVRFLSKLKQSLDLLYGSYIPLRDGSRQFQEQLDLARPSGAALPDGAFAAHTAKSAVEIASHALDWRDDSTEVPLAMKGVFADFVIHQLALVDAVMKGVGALLRELSPEAVEAVVDRNGTGWFGRARARWQTYRERYSDIATEESQAFSLIFGKTFVRAYRAYAAEHRERDAASKDAAP